LEAEVGAALFHRWPTPRSSPRPARCSWPA
jgi:hypothetical protein